MPSVMESMYYRNITGTLYSTWYVEESAPGYKGIKKLAGTYVPI